VRTRANVEMPKYIDAVMRRLRALAGASEPPAAAPAAREEPELLDKVMSRLPLMIADKTYNTSHPDYDANLVRNFPGRVFNAGAPSTNAAFGLLRASMVGDEVPPQAWDAMLAEALAEVRASEHAAQVFERRAAVEAYVARLEATHHARYSPGWVNLEDALFLYWLVRRMQPRTIVQTGVCNGLSSAFMVLALAKNGPGGRLHAIDLPHVFDPADPAWTRPGEVYGVIIPEGERSGWLIPDALRDRVELWSGDAAVLLPKMVAGVDSIDMFFHDSDHTYRHMTFEFEQVLPRLAKGGLLVADDIAWNASLWDLADRHGVPAYNYRGSVGAAFF
jgi:predicted O-methyltransferase YrrM